MYSRQDCCQQQLLLGNTQDLVTLSLYSFQDYVVRISFILGNITGKIDAARIGLFQQYKALDNLVATFSYYWDLEQKVRTGLI